MCLWCSGILHSLLVFRRVFFFIASCFDYYRYMHNNCNCSFFSTWYLTIWVNIWYCTLYSYRTPACYTWHLISDTDTCHAILDTWYLTPVLATDTGTYHAILDTWYTTPILTMLYLTLDIWHWYLPCYTWHLIYDTGTCHAILDIWYLTPILAMLYLTLDIWHWYLPCYTCI